MIKCFGVSKPFTIFAVPKLADGYKPKKIFFAICTVVVAETPTRYSVRPRTPKQVALIFPKTY